MLYPPKVIQQASLQSCNSPIQKDVVSRDLSQNSDAARARLRLGDPTLPESLVLLEKDPRVVESDVMHDGKPCHCAACVSEVLDLPACCVPGFCFFAGLLGPE